jgi:hypothetical protein
VQLLEAVADGREEDAGELAEALANHVLSAPVVWAALQVREAGPLAVARAVGLAERVLEALMPFAPYNHVVILADHCGFAPRSQSPGTSYTRGTT